MSSICYNVYAICGIVLVLLKSILVIFGHFCTSLVIPKTLMVATCIYLNVGTLDIIICTIH